MAKFRANFKVHNRFHTRTHTYSTPHKMNGEQKNLQKWFESEISTKSRKSCGALKTSTSAACSTAEKATTTTTISA